MTFNPSGVPSFIRYFAQTDDSELGKIALAYYKSMIRIAAVRVISLSMGFDGAWRHVNYAQFVPMVGNYVNVVCCHPSRWIWHVVIEPDPHEWDGAVIAQDDDPDIVPTPKPEPITGVEELYTAKVRNVMLMAVAPDTREQYDSARKYQDIIVPDMRVAQVCAARWPDLRLEAGVVPVPIDDHRRVREAIVGR